MKLTQLHEADEQLRRLQRAAQLGDPEAKTKLLKQIDRVDQRRGRLCAKPPARWWDRYWELPDLAKEQLQEEFVAFAITPLRQRDWNEQTLHAGLYYRVQWEGYETEIGMHYLTEYLPLPELKEVIGKIWGKPPDQVKILQNGQINTIDDRFTLT